MPDCRDCGTAISRKQRTGYCPVCVLGYCQTCKARLESGRKSRVCRACGRERWAKTLARRNRCLDCDRPLSSERRSLRCHACWQARYRLEVKAALRLRRDCRDCRKPLPAGRTKSRCTACERDYRRRMPRRPCPMCRAHSIYQDAAYCPGCHRLYQNWRRAYTHGDPTARSLRPKRTNRRWQERSP